MGKRGREGGTSVSGRQGERRRKRKSSRVNHLTIREKPRSITDPAAAAEPDRLTSSNGYGTMCTGKGKHMPCPGEGQLKGQDACTAWSPAYEYVCPRRGDADTGHADKTLHSLKEAHLFGKKLNWKWKSRRRKQTEILKIRILYAPLCPRTAHLGTRSIYAQWAGA